MRIVLLMFRILIWENRKTFPSRMIFSFPFPGSIPHSFLLLPVPISHSPFYRWPMFWYITTKIVPGFVFSFSYSKDFAGRYSVKKTFWKTTQNSTRNSQFVILVLLFNDCNNLSNHYYLDFNFCISPIDIVHSKRVSGFSNWS